MLKLFGVRVEPPMQPLHPTIKEVLTNIMKACLEPGKDVLAILEVAQE